MSRKDKVGDLLKNNGGVAQKPKNVYKITGAISDNLKEGLKKMGRKLIKMSNSDSDPTYKVVRDYKLKWVLIVFLIIIIINFVTYFL